MVILSEFHALVLIQFLLVKFKKEPYVFLNGKVV
jgi:hypothetical protein